MGRLRLTIIVDVDISSLIQCDATVRLEKPFGTRPAPHSNDKLVKHLCLLAIAVGVGDMDGAILHLGTRNSSAQDEYRDPVS